MYFDFRTYFKVIRLVITDRPNPKRLFIHFLLLALLSAWIVFNTVCLLLDRLLFSSYRKTQIRNPVFIVGNARSGTTLFHRLLCGDEERFVCFRIWEILFPSLIQKKTIKAITSVVQRFFPRVSQRLAEWEDQQIPEIKSIAPLGLNKPEEDGFLMLIPFASPVITALFPYVDELTELKVFDHRPARIRKRIMHFYRECVLRQLHFHGGNRTLVSKNPIFVTKMRSLLLEFPDLKFVYLIRSPFETVPSLMNLMTTIWKRLSIDSEQVKRSVKEMARGSIRDYRYALEVLSELPDDRYAVVKYTDLVADPKATVEKVYDRLNLSISPEFEQRLSAERKRQKQYQSANVYSLEEFGLSEDKLRNELSDIIERFGFRPEDVPDDTTREML